MRIPQLMVVVVGVAAAWYARGAALGPGAASGAGLAEPRHHVVYESPAMRIHDIQIPPGDTTLFHTHDTAILYVPIARSTKRQSGAGRGMEWRRRRRRAARRAASARAARPGQQRHHLRREAVHASREQRRHDPLPPHWHRQSHDRRRRGAADDVSGLSAKAELENPWYRAHRIALAPGTATASHRHASQVVVVMQTPGTVAVEGTTWSPFNGPGDFVWQPAGNHVIENPGVGAIELVEVEVRGAQ